MQQTDTDNQERRRREPAVPANLDSLLSTDQLRSLHQIESFGWELAFVRRPLFQDPVPILHSKETGRYALLSQDGEIEYNSDLVIRA